MDNILDLNQKYMKLLSDNNIIIEYPNSFHNVTIKDPDGNVSVGYLSCKITSKELIEMYLEDEGKVEKEKLPSDEEICNYFGYSIVCESPLEILHIKDDRIVASGLYSKIFIDEMKSQFIEGKKTL